MEKPTHSQPAHGGALPPHNIDATSIHFQRNDNFSTTTTLHQLCTNRKGEDSRTKERQQHIANMLQVGARIAIPKPLSFLWCGQAQRNSKTRRIQSRTNRNHHHGREAVQLEVNPSKILPRQNGTATPNHDKEGLIKPAPGYTSSEPVQRQESLLTAREIEVLQAIVNGACNAEIAESLNITPETVKTHVKNILRKLKARDRTQAVVIALRACLVRLPD